MLRVTEQSENKLGSQLSSSLWTGVEFGSVVSIFTHQPERLSEQPWGSFALPYVISDRETS